jgi:hypothetical protein
MLLQAAKTPVQTMQPEPAPGSARRRIHRDFRLPLKLRRFTRRRWLAWAALALFMIAGRIALLPVLPIPDPVIQDEFSYLLAADTFAHGRLVNPPLEHAEFFESPHILVRPVYASKYPPGQAAFMALGQKLAGHPFWGVVMSCALMVFLFCWAADAWLPPHWALIAGGLTVIFFFVRLYWLESYWGGAVAACGGALVVGGLGHLLRGRLAPARFSLAVGAIILYFTRPYEGGVLCFAAVAILAFHFARLRAENKGAWVRAVIAPSAGVLLAGGVLAGWYNFRATGHVTELPFLTYARQYDLAPKFLMQSETPGKHYNNATMAATHSFELANYRRIQALPRAKAVFGQLKYFVGHCLLQPFMGFALLLLGLPWARIGTRKKWLVLLFAAGVAAMLPEVWIQFHYTAPFTVVSVILIVASARALWYRLAVARLRGPVFALSLVILFGPLLFHYMGVLQPRTNGRSGVVRQLASMGGSHLVFVSYAGDWNYSHESVYNGAGLDSAPVLFAHDLGSARDRELVEHYRSRTAWMLRLGPRESDVRLERFGP